MCCEPLNRRQPILGELGVVGVRENGHVVTFVPVRILNYFLLSTSCLSKTPMEGSLSVSAPVAYIVFNRPDHTRLSLARIREMKPRQLFIVADGPRLGMPEDARLCDEVRELVAEIDWDCDVRQDYSERNLGCKVRVTSGLDWVFSHVDRAIVLEDDCIPHPDFFAFCDDLLDRYADDPRVATITGGNFQDGRRRGDSSYYFSRYVHGWGWATWQRAWSLRDPEITFWDTWRRSEEWRSTVPDPVERRYWGRAFDRVGNGDIWDYQWLASTWYHGGLTATPNVNLVSNIGFGPEALHTTDPTSPFADLPVTSLGPLTHPSDITVDVEADRFVFDHVFGGASLRRRRTPWGFVWWLVRGVTRESRRRITAAFSKSAR